MAQRIDQRTCTQCGACLEECPNEGIEEVDGAFIVLAALCSQCYGVSATPRCVEACPVGAVYTDPKYPADDLTNAHRAMKQHPEHFPRD